MDAEKMHDIDGLRVRCHCKPDQDYYGVVLKGRCLECGRKIKITTEI
jgi:hypothetical protein